MKSISKHWSGRELREIVKYNDKLFRIVTGLVNGHSEDCVYMWTTDGWKFVIGKYDTGVPTLVQNTSYVSDEAQRKMYAETLGKFLKDYIKKMF